jgi:mycoredoxin
MTRNWRQAGLAAGCGLVLAVLGIATDSPGSGLVFLLLFLAIGAVLSPLAFPRSIGAAEAQRRSAENGSPIIYWRPGCPFCLRLRARLGRDAGRLQWVNIWSDPEGAAAVRAVTGGDETVPTIVAGAASVVNPDVTQVRELMAAR